MCGIFGFLNKSGTSSVLDVGIASLEKLEYRGYDSAGLIYYNGQHFVEAKVLGQVKGLRDKFIGQDIQTSIGLFHTRWATHGGVEIKNTHPFCDCTGKIWLVHNGVITNSDKLRRDLIDNEDHLFCSETDTEVIVHLIEKYYQSDLESAVRKALAEIDGSYALAVVYQDIPDQVVLARKDSPLIIAQNDKMFMFTSDQLAIKDFTNEYRPLDEGEIVTVKLGGNYKTDTIKIKKTSENNGKIHYKFTMLKEIKEQPQTIKRALKQDKSLIMDTAMQILRSQNVVFTASGSSRFASIVGRYLFSKVGGKLSEVLAASEFQYLVDSVSKNTLVIAVSQSGETADVIQGVKMAKEVKALIYSIINSPDSTLGRLSDRVFQLNCGQEISVAATKSFTSQLVLFYLLSHALVNRLDVCTEQLKIVNQSIVIHKYQAKIKEIAEKLKDKKAFYFIGRGINFAISGEGALKLKEIAYVHAESMSAGELKHGTLALIENGTPVISICPEDYTYVETISNIIEAKTRGAYIIGVSNKNNEHFDQWIELPTVEEIYYPLVTVIPLQLFAYYSSIARGLNPDRPKNLAKSCTVL
jgi:glucosamine--fructose-6-phosphate aminotransferase (isomerizing)